MHWPFTTARNRAGSEQLYRAQHQRERVQDITGRLDAGATAKCSPAQHARPGRPDRPASLMVAWIMYRMYIRLE